MRILFIAGSPPYPPNIGGNQRSAQLLKALARCGNVDLFLALDEGDLPPRHLAEIRKAYPLAGLVAPRPRGARGAWGFLRPLAPGRIDRLADYLASRRGDYRPDPRLVPAVKRLMGETRYDVVVVAGLSLAMKTGIPPGFPVVLDVNDVEREWFKSQIDSPYSGWVARCVARRRFAQLNHHVPELYRQFRHCWVIKARDVRFPGLEHARWLGMPCHTPEGGLPALAPGDPASRVVIMLGSYYHRPNAEGLDWFIQRVWPQVRRAVPEAEFRVIGPGLPAGRGSLYARVPGVTVLGVVPSVVPQYRECAFTIAPIWTGAGINIKVFESYAFGRTAVLTPFAHRGYEDCLENGISVCVAASPEDYARACITLLRDPARRDRLAVAGHPRVMRDFSFERFATVVAETVGALNG